MAKHVLITSLSGSYGGMEIRMLQEAQLLLNAGYRVSILVNPFDEQDKLKQQLPDGVKLYVLKIPYFLENWRFRQGKKVLAWLFYKTLFAWLKPDLVHVFLCWTTYGLTHLWGAGVNKIPSVISIHNVFKAEDFTPYLKSHLPTCFAYCRGGYAVSDSAKQAFNQIYPELPQDRVGVINNWVNMDRFYPDQVAKRALKQELGISEELTVMGCVARMSEQKNLFYLIDIFVRLRQNNGNLYLLLVGSGDLSDQVGDYLEQQGLQNCAQLVGYTERVQDYYRVIDLHALVSLREGFGISTIEAMASGCVCCVTDISGSNDVVHNDQIGLKVPLDDVDTAANLISEVLADKTRMQQLALNAQAEVKDRYERKVIEAKLLAFYSDLASSALQQSDALEEPQKP